MNTTGASTNWEEVYQVQTSRISVLERENEALRQDVEFWKQNYANILKDGERYRFICSGEVNLINLLPPDPDVGVEVWAGTDPARRFIADTLDEAIDDAMKGDNQ